MKTISKIKELFILIGATFSTESITINAVNIENYIESRKETEEKETMKVYTYKPNNKIVSCKEQRRKVSN